MTGDHLKEALKLRHDVCHRRHWPLPAHEAESALRRICELMEWDGDAAVQEVESRAGEAASQLAAEPHEAECGCSDREGCGKYGELYDELYSGRLNAAYEANFGHDLRDRLNQAKWEYIRAHPDDLVVKEIISLARAWQKQERRLAQEAGYEQVGYPTDEEAYGEVDREDTEER